MTTLLRLALGCSSNPSNAAAAWADDGIEGPRPLEIVAAALHPGSRERHYCCSLAVLVLVLVLAVAAVAATVVVDSLPLSRLRAVSFTVASLIRGSGSLDLR